MAPDLDLPLDGDTEEEDENRFLISDGRTVPLLGPSSTVEFRMRENPSSPCMALFDTGATLSYIEPGLVRGLGLDPIGEATDFYPGYGAWTTDIWRLPITLGGVDLDLRFGILPEDLFGRSFSIIGNEAFADREVVIELGTRSCLTLSAHAHPAAEEVM